MYLYFLKVGKKIEGQRRRDSSVTNMLATQSRDLSLIFNTYAESQVWIVTQHWKGRDIVHPLAY